MRMLERLVDKYGYENIKWGGLTEDGAALKKAADAKWGQKREQRIKELASAPISGMAKDLKLTQEDFKAAAPFVPDDVMAGSGEHEGWVYGIKQARERPDLDEPLDPNLSGPIFKAVVRGFRAYREAHPVQQQPQARPQHGENDPATMQESEFIPKSSYDQELRANYFGPTGEKVASSRTTPAKITIPPVGSWRIDDRYKGPYGRAIEQLREVPIDSLVPIEDPTTGGREEDVERYRKWLAEGKEPPPIDVVESDDGKLMISDGHRRYLAAKRAGKKTIKAWVSPAAPIPGKFTASGEPIKVGLTLELAQKRAGPPPQPVQAAKAAQPPVAPRALGKNAEVKTARGTKVAVRYALADAQDLITSHDTALRVNPRYPSELQPRDRTRAASLAQVESIAGKLDPEELGENYKASDGAPITGPDLVVESGNARTIALKRVYEKQTEKAEQYRDWLRRNAERFGLKPEDIDKVERPVLVRLRTSEVDRVQFAKEANEATVAAMSPVEQAKSDAERLSDEVMQEFVPSETGQIATADNREFIRLFFEQVIPETERGEYQLPDGSLSKAGIDRIRNAIFAKAYGASGALEKLAEDPDANIKAIVSGMLRAAPKFAALNTAIAKGVRHDLSISKDIAQAAQKLSALRESRTPVADYLAQQAMFGDDISAEAKNLLQVFDQYKRSGKKISEVLAGYADAVDALGDPNQKGLFGGSVLPTKKEVLQKVVDRIEEESRREAEIRTARKAADHGEARGTAPGEGARGETETLAQERPAKGEVKFSVSGRPWLASIDRSAVERAFPGATITTIPGAGWLVDLPGEGFIRIQTASKLEFMSAADRAAAERAHGRKFRTGERIVGRWRTLPMGAGGVMTLAKLGGTEHVLNHEVFHAAMDLALTPAEKHTVLRKFGSEEAAAEAYARWTDDQKPPTTIFRRILRYFRRLYARLFNRPEAIFGKIRTGEVWARRPGRAGAGLERYSLRHGLAGLPPILERFRDRVLAAGGSLHVILPREQQQALSAWLHREAELYDRTPTGLSIRQKGPFWFLGLPEGEMQLRLDKPGRAYLAIHPTQRYSLFGSEEEQRLEREAERDREKLQGERLTAQFRAPVTREEQLAKLKRAKPAQQTNLFEETPEEAQGAFDFGEAKYSVIQPYFKRRLTPLVLRSPKLLGKALKESWIKDALELLLPVDIRLRREGGGAGKPLMESLRRARDWGEVAAGKRMVKFADAGVHHLDKEERFNLVDVLEGKAEPDNDRVAESAQAVRALLDEIADDAVALEMEVRGESRERSPFEPLKNYYPHQIPAVEALKNGPVRKDVLENLVRRGVREDPAAAEAFLDDYVAYLERGERRESLLRYLVETGQAADTAEALAKLQRYRQHVHRHGSLEYKREINLPFWDPEPLRVIPKHLTGASIRLAQIFYLGQDNQVVNRHIKQIADAGGNADFVRKQVDTMIGWVDRADEKGEKVSRALRALQGFKLGLAAIPNSTQGVLNSLLMADLPATAAGMKALFSKSGRRLAVQSGATIDPILFETIREVSGNVRMLERYLRAVGFTPTERANRIIAANAGAVYAKRLLNELRLNPGHRRARAGLEELGIDPNAARRRGKLTADEVLLAAKKFSDLTQFRSRPEDMPAFASTPSGKVFFQFKQFSYNQTRLLYRTLVRELMRKEFGRAFRNLLILAVVFPMAGEVILDIRSLLTGRKREAKGLERYLDNLAGVGALGILYDMWESAQYPSFEILGPTAGTANELARAMRTKHPARSVARVLERQTPLSRVARHMVGAQ